MNNQTSIQKGDELRDVVARLLRSSKGSSVETEKRLAGKKLDVYYEESVIYKKSKLRVAVECKNYSKKLNSSNIRIIIAEYSPCKENGLIDTLIIVHKNSLTSDGQEAVNASDWVFVYNYETLFFLTLDFRNYIEELKRIDEKEGVCDYHIPPKNSDGYDVEQLIDSWIDDDRDEKHIAVLAEYGMGKTSLAYRIAKRYAKRFSEGNYFRVPVYIKLGDLTQAIDVKGLICRIFDCEFNVDNFTFTKFESLNLSGNFILIYDGFDEMKHAMLEADFYRIFSQLNELARGKAKVLLLGRPNSFLSGDERNWVLAGKKKISGIDVSNHASPQYNELDLAPFNDEDIENFSRLYMEYIQKTSKNLVDEAKEANFIDRRLQEIVTQQHLELIRRPVHAKMLVDLAMSTAEPLDKFTRYELYKHFTKQFFDRELQKEARSRVSENERLNFLRNVATKLWNENRHAFHCDEYNNSNLRQFLEDKSSSMHGSNLLREFVTGSMLVSEKQYGNYYFAHRSFQEYLVASALLLRESWDRRGLQINRKCFTSEILSFIHESKESEEFRESFYQMLGAYDSGLPAELVIYLSKELSFDFKWGKQNPIKTLIAEKKYSESPWLIFLAAIKFSDVFPNGWPIRTSIFFRAGEFKNLAYVYGILFSTNWEIGTYQDSLSYALAAMHFLCFDQITESVQKARNAKIADRKCTGTLVNQEEHYYMLRALLAGVQLAENQTPDVTLLVVRPFRIMADIAKSLHGHLHILSALSDLDNESTVNFEVHDDFDIFFESISLKKMLNHIEFDNDDDRQNKQSIIRGFWMGKPDMTRFILQSSRKKS